MLLSPHLYQSVVRAGGRFKQLGHHVGADSVVLDTERLEAGVLVQGGAKSLYCEVAQLKITNIESALLSNNKVRDLLVANIYMFLKLII